MTHDVFIAYSRRDEASARAIENHLSQQGLRCFRDATSIPGSAKWVEEIIGALASCHAVVVVVSNDSATSKYVRRELHLAGEAGKEFVPIVLSPDITVPSWMGFWIAGHQYLYAIPSLDAVLPSVGDAVWRTVDQSKHRTAYDDSDDVKSRSNDSREIRFDEDRCGLYVGGTDCGVTSVENGAYVLAAEPEAYLGFEMSALPRMTEFVLEGRLTKLVGPDYQWFGIEFGERYPGDYYQVLLNGQGTARLSRHWEKEWYDLGLHEGVRHVRRGNAENTIRAVRKGRALHLFVNGLQALSAEDWHVRVGRLGVMVGPGLRVALSDVKIEGVDLEAVYAKAIEHWQQLEMIEAKPLLQYVAEYEPSYRHPEHASLGFLLAERRPDRRKSVLIVVRHGMLPQLHDGVPAERIREEINRRGRKDNFEWASLVTDAGLLGEQEFMQCPLISIGGSIVNKVTAAITDQIPRAPMSTAGPAEITVQHDVESGNKRVVLWGAGPQDTATAVELFISSGLLDRFLGLIWARDVTAPSSPSERQEQTGGQTPVTPFAGAIAEGTSGSAVLTHRLTHRLIVFLTSSQKTELRVTERGLELYLYDLRTGVDQLKWVLPREELKPLIDSEGIRVQASSKYPQCGVFAIGPYKQWLYSKKLFPDPMVLQSALRSLIEAGLGSERRQESGLVLDVPPEADEAPAPGTPPDIPLESKSVPEDVRADTTRILQRCIERPPIQRLGLGVAPGGDSSTAGRFVASLRRRGPREAAYARPGESGLQARLDATSHWVPGCIGPFDAAAVAHSIVDRVAVGGCQPAAVHSRRTTTAITWLSCSARTVARPHGVRPRIRVPSPLHWKCSDQFCRRGSYSGTR